MSESGSRQRLHFAIRGTVQGVGFRPFAYRLAQELGLCGWIVNGAHGVEIEVEGVPTALEAFRRRLRTDLPPHAVITSLEMRVLDPVGYDQFSIRESESCRQPTALVLPDIATCADCLRELFDPADRRYLYPFTNCTNCGPRYSIIRRLPYDRPNTTMAGFAMCEACRAEYEDPTNRRFHAQPIACPQCGPHLELLDASGHVRSRRHEALAAAAQAIREGLIVALKGLGGFQLIVDARNDEAVRRLRARKRREEKPFALMVPTLDMARALAQVGPLEAQLLTSPESPIVLMPRLISQGKTDGSSAATTLALAKQALIELAGQQPDLSVGTYLPLAPSVAPENPELGLMLPYTPLHHLLMHELNFPVVATSGNLTDEPICITTEEALNRLHEVADLFLTHDRPIERHVDDSVVRVVAGREVVLRRARGYAPLPVPVASAVGRTVLATGAHLKNTVALAHRGNVFLSQHVGDLDTEPARRAHQATLLALTALYEATPEIVACDLHPDYASTRSALEFAGAVPVKRIQHHRAHILACMAENELIGCPVLGIAWDGTGLGFDGQIWGSEFVLTDAFQWQRFAHFRPIRVPGGDVAMREPRRVAFAVLFELAGASGDGWFKDWPQLASPTEARIWARMIRTGINAPLTSGAGRLFDAVGALLGLRTVAAYEGQAAMLVEWAARQVRAEDAYPLAWRTGGLDRSGQPTAEIPKLPVGSEPVMFDWEPMMRSLLADLTAGCAPELIAARFHNTLVRVIVSVARAVSRARVVLSGGCFQNRLLVESTFRELQAAGYRPVMHQRIPPNDGCIALGQAVAACLAREER